MKQDSLVHAEPSSDNCSIPDEVIVPASTIITEETRDADDGDLRDWEYFTFNFDDDPDESTPTANEASLNNSTLSMTTIPTTAATIQLLPASATQSTKIMDNNQTATTVTAGWNAQPTMCDLVYADAAVPVAAGWYSSQHRTAPMLPANTCHMVPYSSGTVPQPELLTPHHRNDDLHTANGGSITNEPSLWNNEAATTEPIMQNVRMSNTTACAAVCTTWYIPQHSQWTPMIVPNSTSTAMPQPMLPIPTAVPLAAGRYQYNPQPPQITPMMPLGQVVPYATSAPAPQPMLLTPPPPHNNHALTTATTAVNSGSCGWGLVYNPIGGGNGGRLCSNTNLPPSQHFRHSETVPLALPREMVQAVDTSPNLPHHHTKEDWTALHGTATSPPGPFDGGGVLQNATTVANVINHINHEEMATKESDISSTTSSLKDSCDVVNYNHSKHNQNVSVQTIAPATTTTAIMSSMSHSTCAPSSSSGEATVNFCAATPATTSILTRVGAQQPCMSDSQSPLRSSPPAMCQPMTAYIYFFRDERDNILCGMKKQGDPLPPPVSDFSPSKLERLLYQRWFVDPMQKRRQHRKSHGKIDFSSLSSEIARRWRELSHHGRDFYRQVAKVDKDRYHEQLSLLTSPPPQHDDVVEHNNNNNNNNNNKYV